LDRDEYHQLRGCKSKIAYESKRDARRALIRMKQRKQVNKIASDRDMQLTVYHCRYCGLYHIGNELRRGRD